MSMKTALLAVLMLSALALCGCVKTASADTAVYYADIIEVTPVPTPFPSQQKISDASKNTQSQETPEPSAAPTEPTESQTNVYTLGKLIAYVDANTVNLRTGPGTDTDAVTELKHFERLYITGRDGEWYKVNAEGKEGYILAEFIKPGIAPTPAPTIMPENTSKKTAKPVSTPKTTPKPTATPESTSTPEPENTPKPVSPDSVSSAGSFSASDVLIVAQITYKESRKGDVDGYKAVANVILNRINSSRYPNTAEGVVFQGNGSQFSPAKNEAVLRAVKPSDECISAVEEVLAGNTILPAEVLSFRAASKGTTWGSKTYYATYGGNAFFG